MEYKRMTLGLFASHLAAGHYSNVAAARRAVGKAGWWTRAEKDFAHGMINEAFEERKEVAMSAKSDIETVADFRAMAELLLGTTDPLSRKDFVGIRKDRVYSIIARLKEAKLIVETAVHGRGGIDGTNYQWCLIDSTEIERRLREIIDDDEQTSALLWPADGPTESAAEEPVSETGSEAEAEEAPKDPFMLLHDILEAWNVRMGQLDQMKTDIVDIVVHDVKRDEAAAKREQLLMAFIQRQTEALEANAKAFSTPPVIAVPESKPESGVLRSVVGRVNELAKQIDEQSQETKALRGELAKVAEAMLSQTSVFKEWVACVRGWMAATKDETEELDRLNDIMYKVHQQNIEMEKQRQEDHRCLDQGLDVISYGLALVSQGKTLSVGEPPPVPKKNGKLPGLSDMQRKKDAGKYGGTVGRHNALMDLSPDALERLRRTFADVGPVPVEEVKPKEGK